MNAIDKVAPYDSADAAYIMKAFIELHAASCGTLAVREAEEGLNGEVGLYQRMFEYSAHCAAAISAVVDFDKADLGVFAYEHLDDTADNSLCHSFFWLAVIGDDTPLDIVNAHARANGWAVLADEAKPEPVQSELVTSIQLQTTIEGDDDTEVCDASNPAATHWSVYLRFSDGRVEAIADFDRTERAKAETYARARAIQYGVEVEPVRG